MNKKLSEIGSDGYFRDNHTPFDDAIVSASDVLLGTESHYVPVFVLTLNDRRELVTEAIKRWEAYKWHKLGGAKELEEFLEDQGL